MRCQRYEAACRIVAETDLLLTMPRRQAEAINAVVGNAAVGNVVLELPVQLPGVELHLYWHRQREADPANQWLRERVMAGVRG